MRGVIWLVLLFVAAVVAATTLGSNDGLVSLYWSGWRLDVSLNLFVIALLLTCLVLLFAMRALQSLTTLPSRARDWRVRRRERAAQAALGEALAEYFGARYSRARKAAERAVAIHEATPELIGDLQTRRLAHLLCGASLHRLQDRPQRDRQLAQLRRLRRRSGPMQRGSDDGVALLATEWALDDRDPTHALALLAELPAGVARRTQALRHIFYPRYGGGPPAGAGHAVEWPRLPADAEAESGCFASGTSSDPFGERLAQHQQ